MTCDWLSVPGSVGRWIRHLAAIVITSLAVACPAQSIQGQSDAHPREFIRTWQEAIGGMGDGQRQATTTLAGNPRWEPYFRSAFNATADQKVRDRLRPALAKCRADLVAWNLDRAKEWAKDLRLDYLTALASSTDDPEAAAKIGQLVLTAQAVIYDTFRVVGPWPNGKSSMPMTRHFVQQLEYSEFSRANTFARLSGDFVSVQDDYKPALVHDGEAR